jgi:hypothetical protein
MTLDGLRPTADLPLRLSVGSSPAERELRRFSARPEWSVAQLQSAAFPDESKSGDLQVRFYSMVRPTHAQPTFVLSLLTGVGCWFALTGQVFERNARNIGHYAIAKRRHTGIYDYRDLNAAARRPSFVE